MRTLASKFVPREEACPLCGHSSAGFHTGAGPDYKVVLLWCDYLLGQRGRNTQSSWCGCMYFYDCIFEEDI